MVRYDLALWLRCIVAWIIAIVLLVALIAFVDNEAITKPLNFWFQVALLP